MTTNAQDGDEHGERAAAAVEIAARLRRRGVRLSGAETGSELVDLLDAVEQFEEIVERRGGDLMVDEPPGPPGHGQPDDAAFLLPERHRGESVGDYIGRITDAAARADRAHPRG